MDSEIPIDILIKTEKDYEDVEMGAVQYFITERKRREGICSSQTDQGMTKWLEDWHEWLECFQSYENNADVTQMYVHPRTC